ncbi:hypothetical protein [Tepidiphilus margaritifer]|uniref:hypothetical protein n=1 Tax=Tepidiphilus margaritifer TaxID=203471 RepID=UPI0004299C6B|nr:hypothetical protein [Tepidiphilus margaritifer]
MPTTILRHRLKADADRTIQLTLPPELGDEVEVLILPVSDASSSLPPEKLALARMTDETGFVQAVLASAEEECWNVFVERAVA